MIDFMIKLLKSMKNRGVVQIFIHGLDCIYDFFKYIRYSNMKFHNTTNLNKLEYLIFLYYHKIEKVLTLPQSTAFLELENVNTLCNLLDKWSKSGKDKNSIVFQGAYCALNQFYGKYREFILSTNPYLDQRIKSFLIINNDVIINKKNGGAKTIYTADFMNSIQNARFEKIINQRHSIRHFSNRHIPDKVIVSAVKLAQRSPSACNRQSYRAHIFTKPEDKEKILKQQNGNTGFGHLADRIIVITSDMRAFVGSNERHQSYIDAGMFSMILIHSLQAQGVTSCCLNLSQYFFQDIKFQYICKIPKWEKPILMIAVGYPLEKVHVTVSARLSTDRILFFRNLDTESDKNNNCLSYRFNI